MIDLIKLKLEIERIYRLLPVKRLSIYGSALTQNFSPSSDVDILVVFDSDENIDLFEKHFELKVQLEKLFGREVDPVADKPFRNPVFRERVENTRTIVYERRDKKKPY